jgi:hypothetical protein
MIFSGRFLLSQSPYLLSERRRSADLSFSSPRT